MKKKLLTKANVLLGAVSLILAGCHAQKKATESSAVETPEPQEQGTVEGKVVCLYGVPPRIYEEQRAQEELKLQEQEKQQQDTLSVDTTASEPPRPMLKYGVPYPRPIR